MFNHNRRSFLIGSLAAAACTGAASAEAATPGLGDIAAARGIRFGSMVKARYLQKDKRYIAMMKREIAMASCFSMQWGYVEKQRGNRDYTRGDQEVDWARAAAKACSAGFLVWDDQLPKWFEQLDNRAESERAIQEHVAETCRHFGESIQLWQVGNEALKPKDLRPDGLAKNVLIARHGIEYLDIAFHAAKEAAPHAELLYNDGLLEYDTPDGIARRKHMLALIDGLLKRGVPITTVGTHGHLFTQWNDKFSEKTIESFFKEISDRGLDIAITELDVGDAGSPADFAQRDADVAATYKRYLDVALANPRLKTVIMWSLTDKDSWVVRGDIKLFARKDGLKPRPMPFDANYDTRPAYAAIAEALAAAPARST
jgi:endo-1,4-beta-xylanase